MNSPVLPRETLSLSQNVMFSTLFCERVYKHSWASLISQLVKNPPAMQQTPAQFLGGKIGWRRDRLPSPVFLGFLCGLAGKESSRNVGDLGSIPGLGRSAGEGKGYPHQYSGLEDSMDCIIHGLQTVRHD